MINTIFKKLLIFALTSGVWVLTFYLCFNVFGFIFAIFVVIINLLIFNRDLPTESDAIDIQIFDQIFDQIFEGAPFDFLPWFMLLYFFAILIISINAANRVGPIAYKYLKTYFN